MADRLSEAYAAFDDVCRITEKFGGTFNERLHPRDSLGRFARSTGGRAARSAGRGARRSGSALRDFGVGMGHGAFGGASRGFGAAMRGGATGAVVGSALGQDARRSAVLGAELSGSMPGLRMAGYSIRQVTTPRRGKRGYSKSYHAGRALGAMVTPAVLLTDAASRYRRGRGVSRSDVDRFTRPAKDAWVRGRSRPKRQTKERPRKKTQQEWEEDGYRERWRRHGDF